jgi:hypothetical protein
MTLGGLVVGDGLFGTVALRVEPLGVHAALHERVGAILLGLARVLVVADSARITLNSSKKNETAAGAPHAWARHAAAALLGRGQRNPSQELSLGPAITRDGIDMTNAQIYGFRWAMTAVLGIVGCGDDTTDTGAAGGQGGGGAGGTTTSSSTGTTTSTGTTGPITAGCEAGCERVAEVSSALQCAPTPNCVADCIEFGNSIDECAEEYLALNECAAEETSEENCFCSAPDGNILACDLCPQQLQAFQTCYGAG